MRNERSPYRAHTKSHRFQGFTFRLITPGSREKTPTGKFLPMGAVCMMKQTLCVMEIAYLPK